MMSQQIDLSIEKVRTIKVDADDEMSLCTTMRNELGNAKGFIEILDFKKGQQTAALGNHFHWSKAYVKNCPAGKGPRHKIT